MMQAMDARAQTAKSEAGPEVGETDGARTPLCFVVDDEPSIRHFLSLILHGAGVDTEEIVDGSAMRKAIERRTPDLIFLCIWLESAEGIEAIIALGKRGIFGYVLVIMIL